VPTEDNLHGQFILFMDKWKIAEEFKRIQDEICWGLEAEDGNAKFSEDAWTHTTGGGGRTRVLTGGRVFEKGGVNFSAVEGNLPTFMKDKVHEDATQFFATGVSIVIHPESPAVPIIHMNIRYFETDAGDAWFGGGIDLTPIYVNDEQSRHFHSCLKEVCDEFNADYYRRFKQWADDYFFITHRNETRGIGGIFFDYLRPDDVVSKDRLFEFVVSVGDTFLKAYIPIVNANKHLPFNEQNKQWQLVRRGRYVEFNLVYDRGTRFGLETGGRIESILMSLPQHASWIYNHQVADSSEEFATSSKLRKGIDWVNM
jgi:coproporphyrinogen III oxidase